MPIKVYDSKMALGSNADIVLISNDEKLAKNLINKLFIKIFKFEKQFSRFLPDSELSKFNKNAGLKTAISSEFKMILQATKKMASLSNGLYNPFILPALQRNGYLKSAAEGYENDPVDDFRERGIATADKLKITGNTAEIPYNSAIDLGGIGKGYLADQLADLIDKHSEITGYFISLGGDMVIKGHDENSEPWQVGIQSAVNTDEELNIILVSGKHRFGVATSGNFARSNQKSKKTKHIIDPRTLKPASTDIKLITLASSSCTLCDVMASCALIIGSSEALKFIQELNIKNFVLQYQQNENIKVMTRGDLVQKKEVYA